LTCMPGTSLRTSIQNLCQAFEAVGGLSSVAFIGEWTIRAVKGNPKQKGDGL